MNKKMRLAAVAAVPLAAVLFLAGCADNGGSMPGMDHGGSSSAPSESAEADFNMADSMFAMMMIPHHQQAVEMSDTILGKDGIDDQVQALAQQIKDAQAPEIELMQSWLTNWGRSSSGDMSGMGHGDGMMSDGDMAALEAADGAEAARLFLEQMIVHHEGAIEMAQTEQAEGEFPDALALADPAQLAPRYDGGLQLAEDTAPPAPAT